MPSSTHYRCIHCCKDLVKEEVGYRSDEHDVSVDRVACPDSPTKRHEPANLMKRIPVQAVMECPCGFRAGDPT
jgi:DNA-directed RNA polymerase subunit RPC12/RpoP